MERINQFDLYDLGKKLTSLAAYTGDVAPNSLIFDFWEAEAALESLLSGRPRTLGVSHAAGQDLLGRVKKIKSDYFTVVNAKGEREFRFPDANAALIPEWRMNGYRAALGTFETVFSAEMREAAAYVVPSRGIFHTPALVDHAQDAFTTEVMPYIPEKTKADWQAAGRCLAFNLLSASGFHVARAVEGTLEVYYQLFANKPGATLHGWNNYVGELEKIAAANPRPTPCPLAKTLAELKQMKDDYRNPIMHPRAVLGETDARMLFANGESLIMAMAMEIKDAREAVQPVLALIGGATPQP